jgi:hypothetical protein
MPDKLIALLVRALEQNSGKLSKRVWKKEFSALTEKEVTEIEQTFKGIMNEKLGMEN